MPNRYVNTAWKRVKLEVAIMDYLAMHRYREVSAEEIATEFQIDANTVRHLLLPYLRDGLISIAHYPLEVYYQLKEDA